MTKAQVEVITSAQRRRRRSGAEKERVVAAALEPGAVASRLRVQWGFTAANCSAGASSFVSGRKFQRCSIRFRSRQTLGVAGEGGVIEIEFATGGRMRISGSVDASMVLALMKALAKGKRQR